MHRAILNISELKVEEPFKDLFLIHPEVLSDIQENMSEHGFDKSQPIIVWIDKNDNDNIVIDGHTRLQAAKNLGIKDIPVIERRFKDENSALGYAISNQRNRRNLNSGQILHFVEVIDHLFPTGGDRKSKFWKSNKVKQLPAKRPEKKSKFCNQNIDSRQTTHDSREDIAEMLGISTYLVSACRHIINNSDRLMDDIEEINNGTKTIPQVYSSSLASLKYEKKKQDKSDKRSAIVKEIKSSDYPVKLTLEHREIMDELIAELLPSLCKRSQEMGKVLTAIDSLKSNPTNFEIFCKTKQVQKFLGSLFVNDFISVLKSFGCQINEPPELKAIMEKRPIKKKHPAPPPERSAARFNEGDFKSHAEINRLTGGPEPTHHLHKAKKRSVRYFQNQALKDLRESRYL